MFYWKIQQRTEAFLLEVVPSEPRLLFQLFQLTCDPRARRSHAWPGGTPSPSCSAPCTPEHSLSTTHRGALAAAGKNGEDVSLIQNTEKLLLKKENQKPNCHIQQLWSWICELHFHWVCFCRCTRLSSLMLASLTCLLISLMVIMVLFHNTIGLSLENIWSGIRTAAIVPCQLRPKVLHFFQVITFSPWTLYIKWYMTKWYCTWCDPEWLKGNSTQHRAVNSQNIDL